MHEAAAFLFINRRNRSQTFTLPSHAAGDRLAFVAPSTGENPAQEKTVPGETLTPKPFEVALVTYR